MDNLNVDDSLKKAELLEKLQSITFGVILTDLVSEYCFELITMTSAGTSYQWIAYDDWNVYRLKLCTRESWLRIREKIKNKTLNILDLEGTEFKDLLNSTIREGEDINYTEKLSGLLELSQDHEDEIYCCFSPEEKTFRFASNQDDLKKILASEYCYSDSLWNDMELGDLENWLERYEEEGQEIPCTYFDEN